MNTVELTLEEIETLARGRWGVSGWGLFCATSPHPDPPPQAGEGVKFGAGA